MTPAEKMGEIVRALEQASVHSAHAPATSPEVLRKLLDRCGEESRRALTLARELRDNAVEGWVAPGRVVGVEFAADDGSFTPGPLSKPAILITDLTP